ncbi:MAG TPA: hypothetical protein VFA90_07935 [Terriglobales bacterium]|nr:hypothetical protein [Terriglobales bacterium]
MIFPSRQIYAAGHMELPLLFDAPSRGPVESSFAGRNAKAFLESFAWGDLARESLTIFIVAV